MMKRWLFQYKYLSINLNKCYTELLCRNISAPILIDTRISTIAINFKSMNNQINYTMNIIVTARCLRMCIVPRIYAVCKSTPRQFCDRGQIATALTKKIMAMKALSLNKSIAKSTGIALKGTVPGCLYNGINSFSTPSCF